MNVALRMDEITPESSLSNITVDGRDNNPLYSLIDGIADDCALELYSSAPYWRLPQTLFDGESVKVEGITSASDSRKVIRLKVGDDFLRVAEIDCADFRRPITEVVPEQSPKGMRQHNRFLLGKETKPVGVMSFGTWDGVVCREIDCYSLAADTNVTASVGVNASYIAQPDAAENVPELLMPALEWLIAARTFIARGDSNHGSICLETAKNLIV